MSFIESDLERAFDEGEFYPVFQPVVELRTCRLAGFEVLARWNHKKLGPVAPDEFIPLLEKFGVIDRLSRAIFMSAFALPLLAEGTLKLAVNISPIQLLGDKLAERIADTAGKSRFPLERLVIEITESALLSDLERALDVARQLKALGCKLALDDFGTGYSSLKHLHTLPFDELKVDRSFINSLVEKRESRKIVAAVLGLGQSLGLTTIAEGVETREQAQMLLWLGCDFGQGWLFGRPVTADRLEAVVAQDLRVDLTATPVLPSEISPIHLDTIPAERLALLQAIYDGAPVGLCFLDRKMRYMSLNRRLAELNGVPIENHLGKTVQEVIPHIFPLVEPYIRRAMQGEPITGVEIHKPAPASGSERNTLLLSYQPARDEAGEILGVSVAIMDITETKRTEAALRESEDHYRHMMHLSPHVPWVLDTRGHVTEAGSSWERLTGQPITDALGNGWLEMVHPEDVPHTLEAIRHSLSTGQPIDIEYRVRRPSGEWIWMRSRGSPRFGPSGRIVCIYGVVEEVHGQKQTSEELQDSKAALYAAINAVHDGMVLIDAQDCTVSIVNPAAQQILGDAVHAGMTLADYTRLPMTHADGRRMLPNEFPLVRTILRGEPVEAKQVIYKQADGSQVWLLLSTRPIYSEDGQLIGAFSIIRDLDHAVDIRREISALQDES
jgi:PAS domain S-box-containing protein